MTRRRRRSALAASTRKGFDTHEASLELLELRAHDGEGLGEELPLGLAAAHRSQQSPAARSQTEHRRTRSLASAWAVGKEGSARREAEAEAGRGIERGWAGLVEGGERRARVRARALN